MPTTTPTAAFSRRLKLRMTELRETGRSVAAAVGVHETTVSGWVNGRMVPEHDRMVQLASHLRVETSWLAYGEGEGQGEREQPHISPPAEPIPSTANKTGSTTKIGARLQSAMTLRQLRTRDLANAVGSHETRIVALLQDRVTPALPEITKLAAALEVTVGWLAFGHEHEAPSRTLQGRDAYLTPLAPPATRVREAPPGADDARTAVQTHIAQGQQQLAQWLVEYSASLLEAAAADARRQLGAVLDHEGNPVPHDDNDEEVARLNAAIRRQAEQSATKEPSAAPRSRSRRSAS